MTRFYVPLGSLPGELTGGRPLEPGMFVDLDDTAAHDPHNARLIAEGHLVEAPEPEPDPAPRPRSRARAATASADEKEGDS